MNVLFVATKPPWPPVDGGRLLMSHTLEELTRQGHHVTLVAPALGPAMPESTIETRRVDARPRPALTALFLAQARGTALSIARHSLKAVRAEVERLLDTRRFDVVHAEQLQAFAQAAPALERGVPVVLRAQNVESDLWAASAAALGTARGFWARREARRLAADEGEAVAAADATVALTAEDAERLRGLAGRRPRVVRVPFAASLPPADARLPGSPAVTVFGSTGWPPNRDAVRWFVDGIWPELRRTLPEARLHVFGRLQRRTPGLIRHPPPADSRVVFAPGSIFAVPLRIASGVRMKILEAWARGVPVVATPAAVRGLDAEHDRELLVAADVDDFVAEIRRLREEPGLAARLVTAARARLAERHDPARVTAELVDVYAEARR